MPYASVNNINLHVQKIDNGNLKRGETIVMLHGLWQGSIATWYFTSAPQLAMYHPVVMYDLRGHGKSEKTSSGYDIDTLTNDLESLIHHLGLSDISLVGHSYGALVALNYSLRHEKRVKKLALVEAPLPPFKMDQMDNFSGKSPDEMLRSLPELDQQILHQGGRRAKKWLQNIDFLANKSTLMQDLKNVPSFDNSLLNKIKIPTILIYGKDSSSFFHFGEKLHKEIIGSTLIKLPGGHYLPIELPKEVTHHLINFFKGNN